jgi:8-oxo-dGTP diphosphatase
MDAGIRSTYGNKVRLRACGICWHENALLLVNHRGITAAPFWAPPGGGVEFGESVEACLKKEFLEETGLEISAGKFLFACEYIHEPLHAIELFFSVSVVGGSLKKGNDPELPIIEDVRFVPGTELLRIPSNELHGIFRHIQTPGDLNALSGFFRI